MYLGGPWSEETGLGKGFSSSSTSRLCFKLGKDGGGRDKFFKAWIDACGRPRTLIHDTTSISTYSSNLEDAEWGYNRDGEKMGILLIFPGIFTLILNGMNCLPPDWNQPCSDLSTKRQQ